MLDRVPVGWYWIIGVLSAWAALVAAVWLACAHPLIAGGALLALLLARGWVIAWDAT